jgi:hypothetical protein
LGREDGTQARRERKQVIRNNIDQLLLAERNVLAQTYFPGLLKVPEARPSGGVRRNYPRLAEIACHDVGFEIRMLDQKRGKDVPSRVDLVCGVGVRREGVRTQESPSCFFSQRDRFLSPALRA